MPEYRNDLQYLRVWVSRLRAKLEPEPSNPTIIRTLQGIGYMLDASSPGTGDDESGLPEPLGRHKRADSRAMAAEDKTADDDSERQEASRSMARATST